MSGTDDGSLDRHMVGALSTLWEARRAMITR
jgi:hypothetical protein